MITVTLYRGSLRLSFPYDPKLTERIHLFGESIKWDKAGRVWLLEAGKFDKLLRHFGAECMVHPDVWATVSLPALGYNFAEALEGLGVTLVAEGSRIVAHGRGVSPVLQEAVDARQSVLRPWCSTNIPERTPERSRMPSAGNVGLLDDDPEWKFLQVIKEHREKWAADEVKRRETIDKRKAAKKAEAKIVQKGFNW